MPREAERPAAVNPPATASEAAPDWLRGAVSSRDGGAPALVTGHLDGLDDEGRVLFVPEGAQQAHPVGIALDIADGALVRAVRRRARALVARTGDAAPRWLLVGLVRERVAQAARDAKPGRLEVAVDGEKVRLEAEHDIELRCGQASITLRYDGRIEVRGTHILSASRGPNRVKGATIALN